MGRTYKRNVNKTAKQLKKASKKLREEKAFKYSVKVNTPAGR